MPEKAREVESDAGRQDNQIPGVDPAELNAERFRVWGLGFRV